jgi:hypothetical protein
MPVDRYQPFAKHRAVTHNMISDLLYGPDLHRKMKPIDDVGRRFRQCPWKPLHDFRAIGQNGNLSVPGISLCLKSLQRSRPNFTL